MKIGFFGTGLMGEPMAKRLLTAGFSVNVYNRTIEKTNKLADDGAMVFQNAAAAADKSDILISMLSSYGAIREVFDRSLNYKGKTFIQMSTVSPEENIELAGFFNVAGCKFIEAPVLGSIPQIKSGSLIVMVSGSQNDYDNYLSLLKNFGEKVIYFGEYGKASAAKLALNQLIASLTASFSMSLGYAREYGVDLEKFMNILRESALYAPTFDKKLDRMLERNFDSPNFPLKHLLKDVNLMINSFSEKGINIDILFGVKNIIEDGLSRGLSEADYSSLYNSVHKE